MRTWQKGVVAALMAAALLKSETAGHAQQVPFPRASVNVTFKPYIQPGDAGPFGPSDTMVVAFQTDETTPSSAYTVAVTDGNTVSKTFFPVGRVVDNYLSSDRNHQFDSLTLPRPYGAHVDYFTPLTGLAYNTNYTYTVTGPGLPASGFAGTFHTRRTGSQFTFEVQGDEGYYPADPGHPPYIVNYEARIIHEMYEVDALTAMNGIPGVPGLPKPDLALNTGDNVYITGSDGNYSDVWFGSWNSDTDNNDDGAPFLRSIPLYVVVGNHDIGGTGASANLLADNPPTTPGQGGPGPFGGGVGGGDAMAHFNNFYDPLNGPTGVDIQYVFNGDIFSTTGLTFTFGGKTYTSQDAIEAVRASTTVDYRLGEGPQRQIDHGSNYSFDYGNAHFTFLDANPHLFNALLPGTSTTFPFPTYPSVLRQWLINDLDGSSQPWKVIVFHQPAFSSGNATLSNDQMRRVAKFLEDHGANMVFSGHEHNYQRTLPLRVFPGVMQAPTKSAPPVVAVDTAFDGTKDTVPDGVLYFVEGAGGNRDFDDNLPNPRGSSVGIDQDDAATGTAPNAVNPAQPFATGSASWLDTNLTADSMKNVLSGAGSGPKITSKFKAKLFSFADIVVDGPTLTLYQISEPLGTTSSATANRPAPYGADYQGNRLNDPLPDTDIDPATGSNVPGRIAGGGGTPALLDTFTITKPDVSAGVTVGLSAPPSAAVGGALVYSLTLGNRGAVALNGTQVVLTLPAGVSLAVPAGDALTQHGQTVVLTLGRLAPGQTLYAQVPARVSRGTTGTITTSPATLRSSTALPVTSAAATTRVIAVTPPRPRR